MKTLDQFIEGLLKLQRDGHGTKPVLYRHSASGDCGPLSTAYVTDEQGDQGPFDVDGEYIAVYAGS